MTTGHYICLVKRKIHREDILQVGMELMFLNGYHASGIKEITQRISIPKGSFYNHFKSKEDFALELLQNYCDNGRAQYISYLSDASYKPVERLRRLFSSFIDGYANMDYKLGCLMGNFSIELSDVNDQFKKLLSVEFDKFEQLIVDCLNEAVEQGQLNAKADTPTIGACILNLWHGALVRMKSTGDEKPLRDFYNLIFNHILK